MYRHFKGNIYTLLNEAILESTGQEMVVYKDYNSEKIWIRPKTEFFGKVEIEDKQIPRFAKYAP